jgi:hypothetical protein
MALIIKMQPTKRLQGKARRHCVASKLERSADTVCVTVCTIISHTATCENMDTPLVVELSVSDGTPEYRRQCLMRIHRWILSEQRILGSSPRQISQQAFIDVSGPAEAA